MPRAPKICSAQGCATLVRDGGSRWEEHKTARVNSSGPWGTSRTATRKHRERRLRVLGRDRYQCQLRYDGCLIAAHICDHIVPLAAGGADIDRNCRAVCGPCHRRITSREANYIQHGTGECPWPDDDPTLKAGPPSPPQPVGRRRKESQRDGPGTIKTAPKPTVMSTETPSQQ